MKTELALLLEEKLKRQSRSSLLAFTKYTFPRFETNWHHNVIAEWCEKLDRRDVVPGFPKGLNGLIICAPPRHTKSEIASVRRPAYSIGRDPARQFMVASYAGALATSFSRATRNIMQSGRYQSLWPVKFKTETDSKWQIHRSVAVENERESMIAAGITQGGFTGEGATDFIVDDPFKNQSDAWSKGNRDKVWAEYRAVATTRLQPNGTLCIQQTRWHEDDLVGRVLRAAAKDKRARQFVVIVLSATNDTGEDAYILNTATGEKVFFPAYEALWPGWFDRAKLEGVKVDLGPVFWSAMYQQAPSIAIGEIFHRAAWRYFEALPPIDRLVHSWDTACEPGKENDYSAMVEMSTWQQGFAIADAWRGQVSFPLLVQRVYEKWEKAITRHGRPPERLLVERKGSGVQLLQQLETNNAVGEWFQPDGQCRAVPLIPFLGMPANESKEIRAHGVSGYQNAGMIWLPGRADWLPDFVDEHAAFPKAANDDWCDAMVHALIYYNRAVPGNEHEEMVVVGDDVSISDELDSIDLAGW